MSSEPNSSNDSDSGMVDPEGDPILSIVYHETGRHGWKPHAVTAGDERSVRCYDFEWCGNVETLVQHCSGFGGRDGHSAVEGGYVNPERVQAKVWLAASEIGDGEGQWTAEELRAQGMELIPEPLEGNPFDAAEEGETRWCTVCRDRYPWDQRCAHLAVGHDDDEEYGCGWEDVDVEQARAQFFCLWRGLDEEERARIRRELTEDGQIRRWMRETGTWRWEHRGAERHEAAAVWLDSLTRTAAGPLHLTLGWIWQADRAGWRSGCVAPEAQFWHAVTAEEMAVWEQRVRPGEAVRHGMGGHLHAVEVGWPLPLPEGRVRSAHDVFFQQDPQLVEEVMLHVPAADGISRRTLLLTVAEVQQTGRTVRLIPGKRLQ